MNLKLVILIGMYTKVLDLIERNRLIFRRRNVRGRVVLWICAESSNVYLAGGDGTIGVDLHAIRRNVRNIPVHYVPQRQRTGLGTFGWSSGC